MVGRFLAKLLGDILVGILVDLMLTTLTALFTRQRMVRRMSFA